MEFVNCLNYCGRRALTTGLSNLAALVVINETN